MVIIILLRVFFVWKCTKKCWYCTKSGIPWYYTKSAIILYCTKCHCLVLCQEFYVFLWSPELDVGEVCSFVRLTLSWYPSSTFSHWQTICVQFDLVCLIMWVNINHFQQLVFLSTVVAHKYTTFAVRKQVTIDCAAQAFMCYGVKKKIGNVCKNKSLSCTSALCLFVNI